MEMRHNRQKAPDVEQRIFSELVKVIRKLRWMGMEQEAEGNENELAVRGAAADSVVASSRDAD